MNILGIWLTPLGWINKSEPSFIFKYINVLDFNNEGPYKCGNEHVAVHFRIVTVGYSGGMTCIAGAIKAHTEKKFNTR